MERVEKDEIKEIVKVIFERYKSINLSRKEASEVLNISIATLDRMRSRGEGPNYIKINPGTKSGKILYPLSEIVKYITSEQIQCA
jgi:predicted DNA-binding transcriptional regulator AlpA